MLDENYLKLRSVKGSDANLLHHLALSCPPLDVHTNYTYWVVAEYFGEGCYILEEDNESIGYIMTIQTKDEIFVWQIGILDEFRGQGYSSLLIEKVISNAILTKRDVYVTIAKDNIVSFSAFSSVVKKSGLKMIPVDTVVLKDIDDSSFYENEIRYKICCA